MRHPSRQQHVSHRPDPVGRLHGRRQPCRPYRSANVCAHRGHAHGGIVRPKEACPGKRVESFGRRALEDSGRRGEGRSSGRALVLDLRCDACSLALGTAVNIAAWHLDQADSDRLTSGWILRSATSIDRDWCGTGGKSPVLASDEQRAVLTSSARSRDRGRRTGHARCC